MSELSPPLLARNPSAFVATILLTVSGLFCPLAFGVGDPLAVGFGEECGALSGGRPVPATRAEMGPDEYLWPRNAAGEFTFRPASNVFGVPFPIPGNRDSTLYRALGSQIPSAEFGLELFTDVARIDGNEDWLFVAYNVGFQVWDLRFDPANPNKIAFRDGWMGHFQEMPVSTKVETYVESIDVIQTSEEKILVGLAGRSGHGFSFWEFIEPGTLVQHCQVSNLVARQVELIEHGGRNYAFVGASDGTYVYDLSDSLGGGACTLEGRVGGLSDGNYVSLMQKDGRLLAAVADGSGLIATPLGLALWEVDPENPADARELFSGFDSNSRAVALFSLPAATQRHFLGFVEDSKTLKIYNIDACLEHPGPGPCGSLDGPMAAQEVHDVGKLYEFLDVSTSSDGRTWGYYGFMTSPGLFSTKFEYLLDLTPLATVSFENVAARGPLQLPEITDGGQTYPNSLPCAPFTDVDYWGDYYPSNIYGLSFFIPRHGVFIQDKFYRAAYTMLDVHEVLSTTDLFSDGFESGGLLEWSSVEGEAP